MQAPELFHARPRRLTRSEYDRIAELGFFRGERVELIHGMVVQMSPIGPLHAEVVDRLMARLVRVLPRSVRVRIQQPFIAADESEPEPDVAIVSERSYASGHPSAATLIIEVAETSLRYDRETKAALYAASNVAEYWIVDVTARRVEIYAGAVDGRYARVREATMGEELTPEAFPEVTLSIGELLE